MSIVSNPTSEEPTKAALDHIDGTRFRLRIEKFDDGGGIYQGIVSTPGAKALVAVEWNPGGNWTVYVDDGDGCLEAIEARRFSRDILEASYLALSLNTLAAVK